MLSEWHGWVVPTPAESPQTSRSSAASAHALLRELREVARALPTSLDEVSLAAGMLSQLRAITPFDRAVVLTYGDSQRATPLTTHGDPTSPLNIDNEHPLLVEVCSTRQTAIQITALDEQCEELTAAFPLRLGDELIGTVVINSTRHRWSPSQLGSAQAAVDDAAIQLDSGRLFSEVRALATMEERRRLAREIHDGIAQEIASLGYVVDEIAAEETDQEQRRRISALREELSRLVSELRLSIFDLRSDVQPHTGLGAALSSYVRQVGASSGLTVHLVLDESTDRLGVETETELLRIAQEAITNARKHSQARNLWVTCRVAPPYAYLRIADDGRGLGSPRVDSYGLDIMRERAGRLGVELRVRERRGGGTVVEISLGDRSTEESPSNTAPVADTDASTSREHHIAER